MINQNTISPYRFFGKKQKTCFSFTTTIYWFAFHVNSCKFNAMKNHKKSRKIKIIKGDFHMTYLEGTTSTDLKHVLRLQTTSYLISPLAEYIL